MIRILKSGPFKDLNPQVASVSVVMTLFAVVAGAVYSEQTSALLSQWRQTLSPFLEWYYVLVVGPMLLFVVWLGTGRYKNVRLGSDEEAPEFTFWSWVAMLFAAGTGIGILFWAVAQPVLQFAGNPFIDEGMTPEAATVAMRLAYFHWGLNGWAIYAFMGLVLGYFAFRRKLPLTIRSALHPLLGDRIEGPIGAAVDVLAVFATLFGIATTLGLGVQQLNAGLGFTFGVEASLTLQLIIIALLMLVATLSVVAGLQRGVRLLSSMNFWLSIAMVLFLLLAGPTQYLIGLTIQATGEYLQNLLAMSFHTNVNRDTGWQARWTVFFWGWWLAWSPFVGMFIARVSRGRTLREFVMGVLLVPSAITVIWLGLFGGTALHQELFGSGGIVAAAQEDTATALFATLEGLDIGIWSLVASTAVLVLIATYLITSANAGALVITTILSGGQADPPRLHRGLWGGIIALLTAVLLAAGGLETLQSAVIMAALPFSLVMMAMVAGLLNALKNERYAARQGKREQPPREPWGNENASGRTARTKMPQDGQREVSRDRQQNKEETDSVT